MKRRVTLFIFSIIIVISIGIIFMYFNKSEINGFPHFKQANIECQGSLYCLEKKEFIVPMVIVDEEELSEMASSDNIKSIYLIDKDSKKISALKWQVQNGYKDKTYIMRSIDCTFICEISGIFSPIYADIEFKDAKTERFEIGKLDIIVKSENDLQKYHAANWFGVEFIRPKVNNAVMASGIILVLDSLGKEVIIEDIDLGVQDFGIDMDKIVVLDGEYNLNYINELRKKNDTSVKIFDSIQIKDSLKSQFKPIHIEATGGTTKYTTLLIPLITKEGVSNSDKVVCMNPTIKIIQDGKHQELYESQPIVLLPRVNKDFIPAKLLKEKGI